MNELNEALCDLYVYCENHKCEQKDYGLRCRIKDVIGCNGKYARIPRDWKIDNTVIEQGIDSDLTEALKLISVNCAQKKCTMCYNIRPLHCLNMFDHTISVPKNWDIASLSNK